MKTINWRSKHGVVSVVLLNICVVLFLGQSCYGARKLIKKEDLKFKDRAPTQMRAVDEMSITIQEAVDRLEKLRSKLIFNPPVAAREYNQILRIINEQLNKQVSTVRKDINDLEAKREELTEQVNNLKAEIEGFEKARDELKKEMDRLVTERDDLKKEMEPLKIERDKLLGQVNDLQSTKITLIAGLGGGLITSIGGIVVLVLKIMSQKKEIQIKQMGIDKKSKKKG